MTTIALNLLKLNNLSKNIKSKLDFFTQQQITVIKQIINICYSHAINNNVVLNSKLLQIFNKLNAKNSVRINAGIMLFPIMNATSNINYFAKIYSSYVDKIYDYLQKNIKNEQQWEDLFELINSDELMELTNLKTQFSQNNDLNMAQETQLLIQKSALQNIILSDLNRMDFNANENKTMDAIRVKLASGNKHQQIRNSDATTLLDVENHYPSKIEYDEPTVDKE